MIRLLSILLVRWNTASFPAWDTIQGGIPPLCLFAILNNQVVTVISDVQLFLTFNREIRAMKARNQLPRKVKYQPHYRKGQETSAIAVVIAANEY